VHTLATSLNSTESEAPEQSPNRHILTRSLKAKRFTQPDVIPFEVGQGSIILATDGYWVEHLIEHVPFNQLADDASYLVLFAGSSTARSDDGNWLALS
jgi:serine/threonine protein phosphatase PrpC